MTDNDSLLFLDSESFPWKAKLQPEHQTLSTLCPRRDHSPPSKPCERPSAAQSASSDTDLAAVKRRKKSGGDIAGIAARRKKKLLNNFLFIGMNIAQGKKADGKISSRIAIGNRKDIDRIE